MTTSAAPDYSGYEEPGKNEDLLQRLTQLAKEMRTAEAEVEKQKEILAAAEEVLRQYVEVKIPETMELARQKEVTTLDGFKITVKKKIRASIPEASKAKAFAWLEETGNGSLIKREFKIFFGREDAAWAKKFERDMAQRKKPLDCTRKEFVETNTLTAFLGKQIEAGVDVPLPLFGAFPQKFASVKKEK